MAINLNNKVTEADKQLVKNSSRKQYRDGFGPEEEYGQYMKEADMGGNALGSLNFDSSDDLDGWDSISDFGDTGDNGFQFEDGEDFGFGGDIPLKTSGDSGFGTVGSTWTSSGTEAKKKDAADEMMDMIIDTSKSLFVIFKELLPSINNRTADDFGYIGTKSLSIGAILIASGIAVAIISKITSLGESIVNLGIDAISAGTINVGLGIMTIFISAYILDKALVNEPNSIDELRDLDSNISEEEEEESWRSLFDFGDEEEDSSYEDDTNDFTLNENIFTEKANESSPTADDIFGYKEEKKYLTEEELLDTVSENTYINRKTLVDTFRKILPTITPEFSKQRVIESYEEDYNTIDTICAKVLSNLLNCEIDEIDNHVEKITETLFCYEIYLKRVKKLSKTPDIEREIVTYFRSSSEDDTVSAKVDIEGDFYRILVSKGETRPVSLGDVLQLEDGYKYFIDESVKLPVVCGVSSVGSLIKCDCKSCDNMIIAGKPNSGKSWFILNILLSLILFHSPEEVQMIIIDPKETSLFNTLALMPHVCGIHNDSRIIDILDEIIEVEAVARKKLFKDNRVDDIWAARKKGINLPLLYLVIDEYITARNNLGDGSKGLDSRLQVVISQFRSLGIRLIFVPHRATGVVDKTNRTMLQFKAAVKADVAEVKDTLDDAKWDRALTLPGDIALKTPEMVSSTYIRGLAIGEDDDANKELIKTAAKVFYKMGVDIPDMSRMTLSCNREPDKIREELSGTAMREQFNFNKLEKELA